MDPKPKPATDDDPLAPLPYLDDADEASAGERPAPDPPTSRRSAPASPRRPRSVWSPSDAATGSGEILKNVRPSAPDNSAVADSPPSAEKQTPPRTDDGEPDEPGSTPAWRAVARGVALFFGGFALLNLLGELRAPGFDANLWWIDLRPTPAPLARGILALVGMLLVTFALRPRLPEAVRRLAILTVMSLLGVALWNALVFYGLLRQDVVRSDLPLPFSLHVAACLTVVLAGLFAEPRPSAPWRDAGTMLGTLAVCLAGFPLAQMHCFGKTDYRRSADVVVVFGCRTDALGRPSPALADRVRTGCRLYHDGLAGRVILSGGPGDGEVHETEAMRQLALDLGVPEEALELDPDGLNTQATVRNTAAVLRGQRVLAVSHYYHLPRIKLCYRRAGIEAYTVPAEQQSRLKRQGRQLAREMAALWVYYLRPLAD